MTSRNSMHPQLPFWLILASFFSAAVQVRLMFPLKFGPQFERAAVARSLAQRGEFADPFSILPTGPTTHVSPVYPIAVAGIMRVFGESEAAALVLTVSCVLMHVLYPILLFLFAREFFLQPAVPTVAAAIAIVLPHFPPMIQVETIYLVNLLLGSFILTWRYRQHTPAGGYHALLEGAMGAICTLVNAAAIVIWFIWLAFVYWRQRIKGRDLYLSSGLAAASFLVVMSPWMIRNYSTFGVPILLRGNLGFELALSNRDGVAPSTIGNGRNGILARYHPNFSTQEAAVLRDEGEVAYNRRKLTEAYRWISDHPAEFASLTVQRLRLFWFPPLGDAAPVYIFSHWGLTLLAAAGLIKLWRDGRTFLCLALGIYLGYPALLYTIQSSIIYTLPIVWLHVICAAYLIASIPIVRRLGTDPVEV